MMDTAQNNYAPIDVTSCGPHIIERSSPTRHSLSVFCFFVAGSWSWQEVSLATAGRGADGLLSWGIGFGNGISSALHKFSFGGPTMTLGGGDMWRASSAADVVDEDAGSMGCAESWLRRHGAGGGGRGGGAGKTASAQESAGPGAAAGGGEGSAKISFPCTFATGIGGAPRGTKGTGFGTIMEGGGAAVPDGAAEPIGGGGGWGTASGWVT